MRHRGWVVGLMASLIAPAAVQAEGLNVSGGLDARAQTGDEDSFAAGFLNLRQVIEQDGVDRWILVGQLDSGENFESPLLYQTYAQLKGPLGRWNVRAGRFIAPFGLLASYDSERLVLNTIEPLSLALKLDTGVQVSGFVGDHDYAVALTEGSGVGDPVLTGRWSWQRDDFNVGLSVLSGRLPETASKDTVERRGEQLPGIPLVDKRRLGLDATWNDGPNTWRGEALLGTDDGGFVKGGYVEYERALRAGWSVGLNGGAWDGAARRWRAGAVVSRALGRGATLRAGYVHEDQIEGREHTFVLQYYWEFSHAL